MKVIITMAGKGSRFKQVGIKESKHEIMAGDYSLFTWSIRSLAHFFEDEFYFIVRANHFSPNHLKEEIVQLGIVNYHIIILEKETLGQADTVMQVDKWMTPDDSFLIFNIDTAVQSTYLTKEVICQLDGSIPVFNSTGTHWSFAKIDEQTQRITEVVEKERISSFASIGLYYFNKWKDYKNAFYAMKEEILDKQGEIYVAPLYSYLLSEKKQIVPIYLPEDSFAVLGTPEELTSFIENKMTTFFIDK